MEKLQRKRYTPEQIIRKLRQADEMLASGQTIGQVVQFLGISEQTFHRLRLQIKNKDCVCYSGLIHKR